MKKIVLTLGIFLSAYATYAVNSNEKLNSNRVTEETKFDDECWIREETYDVNGNYLYSTYYPC